MNATQRSTTSVLLSYDSGFLTIDMWIEDRSRPSRLLET